MQCNCTKTQRHFIYGSASQVHKTFIRDKSHQKTLACAAPLTWQWQVRSLRVTGGDECKLRHEADSEALKLDFLLWYKSKWKQSQAALGGQVWLPPHPSIIRKCCVFAAELKVSLLMIVSLPDEWSNEEIQKHHTRDQCYNAAACGIL